MKEIIVFSLLLVSVLFFALDYKPEPVIVEVEKIIEKPVVVEKIVEKPVIVREKCETRDSPKQKSKRKPKTNFFKSYKKTFKSCW